jgi:hypothetical protein
VAELKKELKDRGIVIPASGLKKSDLIAKLAEALGVQTPANTSGDLNDSTSDETKSPAVVPAAKPVVTAAVTAASVTTAAVPSDPPANGTTTAPTAEPVTTKSASDEAKGIVKVTGGDPKDRLAARAARFGTTGPAGPTPAVSIGSSETLAALKKRTERFGEVVSSTVKSLEEKEKLNQRANRFNLTAEEQNPATKLGLVRKASGSTTESVKRPITTLSPEEEERLRKRRERFGLT